MQNLYSYKVPHIVVIEYAAATLSPSVQGIREYNEQSVSDVGCSASAQLRGSRKGTFFAHDVLQHNLLFVTTELPSKPSNVGPLLFLWHLL